MPRELHEKNIQNYLYEHLEELPEFIGLQNLESSYELNRDDLLHQPLKYLLNKQYQKIFQKMQNFSEGLHKFSKEYHTAELGNSRPRIDILSYQGDPCTFYITEVKWDKNPERQTITELLQYANGLQTNDFPGLSNDNIVFVIVAREWSNILIQSTVNSIVFKNLNILPIQVIGETIDDLTFSFFDLWNTGILENLNRQIYNEDNYLARMLAFDEFPPKSNKGILKATYENIQMITMATAIELAQSGYIGYVLGMEYNGNIRYNLMYGNGIAVLCFNPLSSYIKNWNVFSDSKQNELFNFESEHTYNFNTNILRKNIKYHYPSSNISFEEGDEGIGITGLSAQGWIFSYGYPIGFLEILIKDFILYCKEDRIFAIRTIQTDDVGGSMHDNISHWMYLNTLFKIQELII